MTAKQLRAIELHAKRLAAQADAASRHYDQLRATFPEYNADDGGLLMIAARHTDDAGRAARQFGGRVLDVRRRVKS